jgi:hypothetical protein
LANDIEVMVGDSVRRVPQLVVRSEYDHYIIRKLVYCVDVLHAKLRLAFLVKDQAHRLTPGKFRIEVEELVK